MYPFLRTFLTLRQARQMPPMGMFDTHVSQHRVLPWDADIYMELNNGRTLTLFELGRWPLAVRIGLADEVRRQKIAFAVAGVSVRYRHRLPILVKFTTYTRLLGWDDRFLYVEQSMWQGERCANHMLLRAAFKGPQGTVPPAEFLGEAGLRSNSPALPLWVTNWIEADATRPWPPARAEPTIGD
ncbi:MAG: acyl-CoA thioesterase [Pseudomonadota bacterium]